MTLPALPGLILLAGLIAAAAGLAWRSRRWAIGRPAAVPWIGGLFAVPKRYFVDVHHVVSRDPYAARMHVLAAGGFTAALLVALLVHLFGIGGRWLAAALLPPLAAMAAGTLMVAWRRRPEARPERLSRGGFDRLPWGLAAFALFFALATLPRVGLAPDLDWQSWPGLALLAFGLWGTAELLLGLAFGPMKHAAAGALHLAWHPRPLRFEPGAIESGLRPLDLDAPKLGVETPSDFAWNQLLGFDACVQCGRCETACPAFAAGLPLNPKKLIQDLMAAERPEASDAGYRGSPYPGLTPGVAFGGPDEPIIGEGAMVDPSVLWSCTTCRACVQECPMMIEHVDAIIDLRRFQTLELGLTPGKGPDALMELQATDNPGGRAPESRLDWAADLNLPLMSETGAADMLLWLGDGAFELRNQRTLRALVKLLRLAKVDFAVLGTEELDTGDIARRLGDEATFQALARRNIAALAKYRFERIVTADPHVLHCLRNEYPALGGNYTATHHTALLAELLAEGRIRVAAPMGGRVTYHDPCYLARYNGEIEAPRAILSKLGVDLVEMERAGLRARCCGGGGGAPLTDIPGKRRIPDMRMEDAKATEATTVAVACPNCALMLEGVVQPRPVVADVSELLLQAAEGSA
jgi:Fe-S oxidoreductase